jgi:hypothetical protein
MHVDDRSGGSRAEMSRPTLLQPLTTPSTIIIRRVLQSLSCLLVFGVFLIIFGRLSRERDSTIESSARMSSTAALKHLKVAPKEPHKATVIFLHVRRAAPEFASG